jgi:predicted DNA-binding protein
MYIIINNVERKIYMERTQIYIDTEQKKKLQKIAAEESKTMSEVIREAIVSYIADNHRQAADKLNQTSGLWKDRKDIKDSVAYTEELRKKWYERLEVNND